jgi:hypothetical protein
MASNGKLASTSNEDLETGAFLSGRRSAFA